MANWKALFAGAEEITVILETRTTSTHQSLLARRARSSHFNTAWAAPVPDGPTTAGRSGGILIMAKDEWNIEKIDALELEAPSQHWLLVQMSNPVSSEKFHLLGYYGHPDQPQRTLRDLRRAAELMRLDNCMLYVAGDFNLDDDMVNQLDDAVMVDAAAAHAATTQLAPAPTFLSPVHGYSRPDRFFLPRTVVSALKDVNVVEHFAVPSHYGLVVSVERHHIARALPPLRLDKREPDFDENAFLTRAADRWATTLYTLDLNRMYETWSEIWEDYLIHAYQDNHLLISRGKAVTPKAKSYLPFRPQISAFHRRLACFVKRLETLLRAPADPVQSANLWRKVATAAPFFARLYGVPAGFSVDIAESNIFQHVLEETYKHFRRALQREYDLMETERRTRAREAINRNKGVNKRVATFIKDSWIGMPKVFEAGNILDNPSDVLQAAHRVWSEYFDKNPAQAGVHWQDEYLQKIQSRNIPMDPLTAEHLRAALAKAKKSTSPSTDSWRMQELAALPQLALQQLAQIYSTMEAQGTLPTAMSTSWTALTSKTRDAVPPGKLRPIAVLSCLWRLYGMARLNTLSAHLQDVFPSNLFSYVAGRSALQAALSITERIEKIKANQDFNDSAELYVLGLDATKAFPSASRLQLAALMDKVGLDPRLRILLEAFYNGETCFRIAGQYCHSTSHKLKQGVHQGCPLSVMMFNMIQLPIITHIVPAYSCVQCSIYADDIVLVSTDLMQLQDCLNDILRYLGTVAISINPQKTRFWASRQGARSIKVHDVDVLEASDMKILGITLTHQVQEHGTKAKVTTFHAALTRLQRLPLTLSAKQLALGAIALPSIMFDRVTCTFRSLLSRDLGALSLLHFDQQYIAQRDPKV